MEESPLIWGALIGAAKKKKKRNVRRKSKDIRGEGPPLLQLTGENKERKALETKREGVTRDCQTPAKL